MVNLTNDEMEFGFSTVKRASHIAITQQCSSPSHSKTLKNVLYIYIKKRSAHNNYYMLEKRKKIT